MNLYLVQIIIKFLRLLFIAFISFFNITIYAERENIAQNELINKDKYAVNKVILKEDKPKLTTIKNNSNQIKKATTSNQNNTTNKKEVINNQTNNKEETTKKEESTPIVDNNTSKTIESFTGRLTGYGPDCAGCSGYGNLACRTREKKTFSLKNDGIYYTDSEYGKVRILAAATTKFKCGTIITVTKEGQTPFNAVVLDTGGSMRKAWASGSVWMDLAYSTEAMAGSDSLTGKNIKFDVQRYGW